MEGNEHGSVCVGRGTQCTFPPRPPHPTPFLGGKARRKVAGVPRGPPGTCRGAGAAARCGVSPVRGRGRWLGFGRRCEKVELLPGGAGGDGGSRSFCAECQTFPWLPFLHPRHPFPLPRTHMHTPPANGLLGVRVCVCVWLCVRVGVCQPTQPHTHCCCSRSRAQPRSPGGIRGGILLREKQLSAPTDTAAACPLR